MSLVKKSVFPTTDVSPAGRTVENISFKKLFENSQDGLALLDANLQTIYRSASAERINGWNAKERARYSMTALIHPDDAEAVTTLINNVRANPGGSETCAFRAKHFDGHYIWIESTFTNLLDDLDIQAIVCNFRDVTQKRQDDELLQQTMKELFSYKHALDEASIVAITDQKGIIQHVNDNFCRISKYSAAELIGHDHRIINSGYHDKEFIRNLWVTIARGNIWKGELKNKAKDGSYYWVDTTIIPFLNEDGKPYQYVAIRSDITERKLTEEKIIESDYFTKTITDNLPALIAYFDADLYCLFANKPYVDWFEKRPHEILGVNKRDILGREEFEQHELHIREVLKGKPQRFERIFYKADGKTIDTDTQYLPDIEEGKVKGFFSLIYDVTAIKLVEVEVKKKTEQIENILESITDGFIAIDGDMRYTYGNKRIEAIFGVPVSAILGKTLLDIFPGAIETETYKSIKKALDEKIPVSNDDYYAPLNLWTENRIFPARDGVSMFIRDITERKNDELQKSLLSEISLIFNEKVELNEMLRKVLELLVDFGNFSMAEAWLVAVDKNKIQLAAVFPKTKGMQAFYEQSREIKSFVMGQGLPGTVWEKKTIQFWPDIDKNKQFLRRRAAKNTGLKTGYGIPFMHNNEVIGVLLLGLDRDEKQEAGFNKLIEGITDYLGAEIKRKQLEQELNQIFNFTPDILCIANTDGYFKKVNPAMAAILEYSEYELLSRPFMQFVHPLDKEATATELQNIITGNPTYYIENRYITKSGKIKWLAWTTTEASEQGVLYCSAKDVTDKKDLEVLLHKATDLARIGGWEIDRVKETVYWSSMTREILEVAPGFDPDLEKGMDFYKEGESRIIINQVVANAIANGTSWDVELEIITAKGNTKWVRVIGEAEFAENKCTRIIGSFQDIDARKKAEIAGMEALKERNTILESIDDAFFAVDKNWIVTYWNNMAEKLFKTPKSEILNQNLLNKFPGWVGSDVYKKYCGVIDTGQGVRFEHKGITLNAWLEISAYPAENGLTVYVKDITDRKKADALAIAAFEEKNTILESIDDAFFALDKNWVVTYWNKMAEKVLQMPKEAILNHNLWDIFSHAIDSLSYKKYHQAVATNKAAHFEDYSPSLEKWFEVSAYPSESGLTVYFKDISDRKLSDALLRELNENLKKHAKELAISNAELEQFAYVASHDLQEPLRMVTSFMTQLEKKYGDVVDDRGRQYIHFAVDGAKRMRQIILDLLDFSRVGRTEDDLEEIDFNKLINEILALYRRQIEEDHATITFENLPTFQTYKTPIRQVFQNLISNSLKYHRPGTPSVISISCKETKAHFQFSVKDNGIGISSEYFDKIFIIFQRLHNKDEYSGTGMGLAIAKKIVENLGGKIWVKSEDDNGSTFYFTLLKN
ncbi:MAG TPA: PAS domain S-box protein [Mucilaginibacter sp.]